MKEEKVSVIIPVYNAYKNISKCLDSILKQKYTNLEIICINDGSKDGSENIILNYAKSDNRIKLINKENSGVSDTRNMGIDISTGEYIMFIDADDYIEYNYIFDMVEVMNRSKSDLVISGYTELKNKNEIQKTIYMNKKSNEFDITYPKEIYNIFSTYEYNPCWKQLIRRNLLMNNNIRFDKSIKYGEDMLFSFYCYINSVKTVYLKNFGYYYYINDDSVMNKKDLASLNKYYDDNKITTELILNMNNFSSKEVQALYFKTLCVFEGISYKFVLNSDNYKIAKENILNARRKYNNIFSNCKILQNGTWKEKISIFLLKYRLLKIYYMLKK